MLRDEMLGQELVFFENLFAKYATKTEFLTALVVKSDFKMTLFGGKTSYHFLFILI